MKKKNPDMIAKWDTKLVNVLKGLSSLPNKSFASFLTLQSMGPKEK